MSQSASTTVEIPQAISNQALPEGWHLRKLGDVCRVVGGSTPSSGIEEYWNGDIVWITPTDLGKLEEIHITSSARQITQKGYDNCRAEVVPVGSVVLSSRAPIGHLGIAGVPLCTNQGCKTFIPSEDIDSRFLYFALKQSVSILQALGSGATFAEVSKTQLENFKIVIPPLSEQKRIAAILNEQLAEAARARAAAEAQLKAAKDLPAAYLRSAFDSSKAQQWTKKRIGDVALLVQNGIYKAAEHYGHGHPFLRMYNVQNNSWVLNLDRLALVNLEGKEEQTFALRSGDLLISRVNSFELVGKCAWVGPNAEGFVFENMLIRVQLDSSVNSLFMAQQMATAAVRKQIEAVAKRAIGQASINSADLRAIEIALPSLDVQEQIAHDLSARVAGAEQTLKALQDQLNTIDKLLPALLRQAFTGKF